MPFRFKITTDDPRFSYIAESGTVFYPMPKPTADIGDRYIHEAIAYIPVHYPLTGGGTLDLERWFDKQIGDIIDNRIGEFAAIGADKKVQTVVCDEINDTSTVGIKWGLVRVGIVIAEPSFVDYPAGPAWAAVNNAISDVRNFINSLRGKEILYGGFYETIVDEDLVRVLGSWAPTYLLYADVGRWEYA